MNYHVKRVSNKNNEAQIIFHITVPAENNSQGKSLSACIVEDLHPSASAVPWLESDFPAEFAQIIAGEIYEYMDKVKFNANATILEKRNMIDARYNNLVTIIQNKIRNIYSFWGLNRDV